MLRYKVIYRTLLLLPSFDFEVPNLQCCVTIVCYLES